MRDLLIWSKDRACQLDLLLRSIYKFTTVNGRPFFDNITVLTKSSSDCFKQAYDLVGERHKWVKILYEDKFYENTLFCIKESVSDDIYLSTDDTVFYRELPVNMHPPLGQGDVFSLRLGFNTLIQDCHARTLQPPLNKYQEDKELSMLMWNPHDYHPLHNYGYPFGLDMHGYNRKSLVNIINGFKFKNTNELESNLFKYRHFITQMFSFRHSCAVNIPCNTISNVTRAGEKYGYSLDLLNKSYLNGQQLSLESVTRNKIIGCHQEMELEIEDVANN